MEVKTKFHGAIKLLDENVITFLGGIPGFQDESQFAVLPIEGDNTFLILQSLNTTELAFVIVNPFHYFPEYNFTLEDHIVEKLNITSTEDVLVYSVLTIQEPFANTTANLQAPIIINTKEKLGKQVILNSDTYTTRHKILEKR